MSIKGDNYSVEFNGTSNLIVFSGVLRLQGKEHYQAIYDLLVKAVNEVSSTLKIDMTKLEFLNSSGISSLCLFAIYLRSVVGKRVIITGTTTIAWQAKSLANLLKFTDKIELKLI